MTTKPRCAADTTRSEVKQRKLDEAKAHLGGACIVCGLMDNLQFDHVDPATKLFDVTKGTERRREVFWSEVDKCQLLCKPHHEEKSTLERSNVHETLRELDVKYIRELRRLGYSQPAIAREFQVSQMTISNVVRRKTWAHV